MNVLNWTTVYFVKWMDHDGGIHCEEFSLREAAAVCQSVLSEDSERVQRVGPLMSSARPVV